MNRRGAHPTSRKGALTRRNPYNAKRPHLRAFCIFPE